MLSFPAVPAVALLAAIVAPAARRAWHRAAVLDWVTAPLRLRRATGQHAAPALGLVFDVNRGQWRHAETGPLVIDPGYGVMRAAERLWRQP